VLLSQEFQATEETASNALVTTQVISVTSLLHPMEEEDLSACPMDCVTTAQRTPDLSSPAPTLEGPVPDQDAVTTKSPPSTVLANPAHHARDLMQEEANALDNNAVA